MKFIEPNYEEITKMKNSIKDLIPILQISNDIYKNITYISSLQNNDHSYYGEIFFKNKYVYIPNSNYFLDSIRMSTEKEIIYVFNNYYQDKLFTLKKLKSISKEIIQNEKINH